MHFIYKVSDLKVTDKKNLVLTKISKMKYAQLIVSILLLVSKLSFGQESAGDFKCFSKNNRRAERTTVLSASEDNYDVKYIHFDLKLSNDSTYIDGNVTTSALVVGSPMSAYVFELDSALTIDHILINGAPMLCATSGDIRTVSLPAPIMVGSIFTAEIVYHGNPYTTASIFNGVGGINKIRSNRWGTTVVFTQSESYHAKEWWPCKQSLLDKIDSVDIWITVPDSLKAGSNGVLSKITTIDGSHKRYEWKEKHPIDYYLISASVANYIDYSYYMHFTGSTDSMLIQNYIYSNPLTLLTFKRALDSVGLMVDYFSQIYSRYPFWNEKYGHCLAPLNGGMEHQTMTTIGFLDDPGIIAHELSHQWFGDNVTCSTWSDIFVNEGMASYSEDLFKEHFHSRLEMVMDMMSKQADVRKIDTGSVYCEDTTDESRIFSSRFSYHKGACLLHMLRYVINSDSTFFQVLKSYQQEHKNANGSIEDFRIATKSITGLYANGINIDTFFSQWAYKYGYPVYAASWNRTGNDFYLLLKQTPKVGGSVACFKMPLDIMLHSTSRDTIIRIMADQPEQLYHFIVGGSDSLVAIDPFHWVLDSFSSIIHDRSLNMLSLDQPMQSAINIYPNPTTSDWTIENLPLNSRMILTDIMGKVLWERDAHTATEALPSSDLAQGVYILRVNGEGVNDSYKLIKG